MRACLLCSDLPVNGLLTQVGPEDHLLVKVCIQGHCVPLLLHQLGVLLPLQAQAPDVTAVSENQTGLLTYGQEGLNDKPKWKWTSGQHTCLSFRLPLD